MSGVLNYYIENGEIKNTNSFIKEEKGKVIYEVIKIINGRPLFLEEHIRRFNDSFNLLNINYIYSYNEIKGFIKELIEINKVESGNIKITFNTFNEIIKLFFIKHSYPTKEMYEKGVNTIFYHGERHNPNAKVVDDNFRNKVIEKIKLNDAYEAILVNNQGYITEGSKSNIFIIKDNIFYTSEVKEVLPGVTRGKVIEVLKENSLEFVEKNINYLEINENDSVFITGTSPDVLPVCSIDGMKVNMKKKELRNLMKLFEEKIKKDINGESF